MTEPRGTFTSHDGRLVWKYFYRMSAELVPELVADEAAMNAMSRATLLDGCSEMFENVLGDSPRVQLFEEDGDELTSVPLCIRRYRYGTRETWVFYRLTKLYDEVVESHDYCLCGDSYAARTESGKCSKCGGVVPAGEIRG